MRQYLSFNYLIIVSTAIYWFCYLMNFVLSISWSCNKHFNFIILLVFLVGWNMLTSLLRVELTIVTNCIFLLLNAIITWIIMYATVNNFYDPLLHLWFTFPMCILVHKKPLMYALKHHWSAKEGAVLSCCILK